MTNDEYEKLPWPARIKLARLALPKATKTALAKELNVSVHTVVNWESGTCKPQKQYIQKRIEELCTTGIAPSNSGISIDFLLGGFDANEAVMIKPLLTRDKAGAEMAMMAVAIRLLSYVYNVINKTVLVTSIDSIFNTYPGVVYIHLAPAEFPDVRYLIKLSHIPAGIEYTMDLLVYKNSTLINRYVANVSDSSIATAIRLIKKSINKLK